MSHDRNKDNKNKALPIAVVVHFIPEFVPLDCQSESGLVYISSPPPRIQLIRSSEFRNLTLPSYCDYVLSRVQRKCYRYALESDNGEMTLNL